MKYIRFIFAWLSVLLVVAGLLVAVAFSPYVQTWGGQYLLSRYPALHGSVNSVSAGLSSVELGNLNLTGSGAVLTMPRVQARLPLFSALFGRKLVIHSLVAKGWTLDLTRQPPATPPAAAGEAAPSEATAEEPRTASPAALQIAQAVYTLLHDWQSSCDLSVDGVDLAGDVLVRKSPDSTSIRVHVTIKGGGLSATAPGTFVIAADAADMQLTPLTVSGQARVVVALKSPRTFGRFEVEGEIPAWGQSGLDSLPWSVAGTVERASDGVQGTLNLGRNQRPIMKLAAHFGAASQLWQGTWQAQLGAADLAAFAPAHAAVFASVAGDGTFEGDEALTAVKLQGRLNAVTNPGQPVLGSWSGPPTALALAATFDAQRRDHTVRVTAAKVALTGPGPGVAVEVMQPFSFDENTLQIQAMNLAADWLGITLRGVPLAWLGDLAEPYTFSGGEVTGDCTLRKTADGLAVQVPAPLRVTGVAVARGPRVLAHGLDAEVALQAGETAGTWQARLAPLEIGHTGQRWATIEASVTRPADVAKPLTFFGKIRADLSGEEWRSALPMLAHVNLHSAMGEFSGSVGADSSLEGKVFVLGRNPANTLSATVTAQANADGTAEVVVPVRIAFGVEVSELAAVINWAGSQAGQEAEIGINGQDVALAPWLRLAAAGGLDVSAALAAAANGPVPVPPATTRDQAPFWGDWSGRVTVQLEHLRVDGRKFDDVGGHLQVTPTSVQLASGHLTYGRHGIDPVEGSIAFDPAAAQPYSLRATAAVSGLDAVLFFGFTPPDHHPELEGHFDVAATVTGVGASLPDVAAHAQEEFRLKSTVGITRLLQTYVGELLSSDPQVSNTKETLENVGSAFGRLFGARGGLGSGEKKLSPNTEAVLDLDAILAEVGYDSLTVRAIREPDGRIHLPEIELIAAEEHLTGSGEIGYVAGRPLATQPFSADLQLGAKDAVARLLTKAGLLSTQKDALGYALLAKPFHWGGTLAAVDRDGWRKLLAEAGKPKPVEAKKHD